MLRRTIMKRNLPLMKNIFGNKFTKRNRFTRQCIGESVISLMKEKKYDDITISDIVKKAGVSRMTFYHYFPTKTDALNNYLYEVIEIYLEECSRSIGIDKFDDAQHIRHAFLFFDQYAEFFLTLAHANLHALIINAINEYMIKMVGPIYPRSAYELYFYAGALFNTFLKWEEDGKKQSIDDIIRVVCQCCNIKAL